MSHRDDVIIKKVLSEIKIAFEMMGETDLEHFLEDEKLKRAVCMTVVNIGELVKNISEQGRKEYAHIPWNIRHCARCSFFVCAAQRGALAMGARALLRFDKFRQHPLQARSVLRLRGACDARGN